MTKASDNEFSRIILTTGVATTAPTGGLWELRARANGIYAVSSNTGSAGLGPLGTGAGAAAYVGASVYNAAGQTISNTTATALTFDSEDYDTSTFHDTGSNTSRLTVPTTGKYLFTVHAYYDTNTTGVRQLYFRLNGSTEFGATALLDATGGDNFMTLTHVKLLTAADYVEVMTYQDSGGNRSIGDTGTYGDRYKNRFTATFLGT